MRREIPDFLRYKYCHIGDKWADKQTSLPEEKIFRKVIAIMRANPPQINHTAMLKELCDEAMEVNINLGSSNKFNNKNPFRIEEREEMMRLGMDGYKNFKIYRLPDFADDDTWFVELCKINGDFTEVLSNNQSDLKIYQAKQYPKGKEGLESARLYDIIQPVDVIDQKRMKYAKGVLEDGVVWTQFKKPVYVSGTFVRAGMVKGWNWEDYIDEPVAKYLKDNKLIKRLAKMCPELEDITIEKIDDGR